MHKLGIFIVSQSENWGPGKVGLNLVRGLEKKNIAFELNTVCDINFCPHGIGDYSKLPDCTPVGPNIFSTPSDQPQVVSKFKNFVFNCEWTKKLNETFKEMENKNKYIWPVGIDTDTFKKEDSKIEYDCFIYSKGRSSSELDAIHSMLDLHKQTYTHLRYGSFSPLDIVKYSSMTRYCIIHDGTETQGIANMEILSCGSPCFVFDAKTWKNGFPATSMPYFDSRCGIISEFGESYNEKFAEFLNNIHTYNSREYMLDNHTLEKSIVNLMNIVEECHADK